MQVHEGAKDVAAGVSEIDNETGVRKEPLTRVSTWPRGATVQAVLNTYSEGEIEEGVNSNPIPPRNMNMYEAKDDLP